MEINARPVIPKLGQSSEVVPSSDTSVALSLSPFAYDKFHSSNPDGPLPLPTLSACVADCVTITQASLVAAASLVNMDASGMEVNRVLWANPIRIELPWGSLTMILVNVLARPTMSPIAAVCSTTTESYGIAGTTVTMMVAIGCSIAMECPDISWNAVSCVLAIFIMANRRLEILVHTTAPSLGQEDALYRSLAAAYLDFEPQGRIDLYDGDDTVSGNDASGGYEDSERQLHADMRASRSNEDQGHMFLDGFESYLPASQLASAPRKEYLTTSKITTAPSSAIQFLDISFTSVDGVSSPRFRTRDPNRSSNAGEKGVGKGIQREQQLSRSIICSQAEHLGPRRETGGTSTSQLESSPSIPTCSTPSVVRDTFLSQFESPCYSSPSPVRAPLSPPPAEALYSEIGDGERQSNPTLRSRANISSPLSPAPTRNEEAPSTTLTSALRSEEYSSPLLPGPFSLPLGQYNLQVRRTPPPDSPHRSPKKRSVASLPSPTPARKFTRLLSDPTHVSDTPPAPFYQEIRQANPVVPTDENLTLVPSSFTSQKRPSRKRHASRISGSSAIYPLPAPASEEISTTFLTAQLANLAAEIGYARFRPMLHSREVRKHERGYWGIDVHDAEGGWDDRAREKTWEFLREYIGRGKAGWGVWCVRNGGHVGEGGDGGRQLQKMEPEGEQWRIYCWGEIVSESIKAFKWHLPTLSAQTGVRTALVLTARKLADIAARTVYSWWSFLGKGIWTPDWVLEGRKPAFVTAGNAPIPFGGKKYLWGNVPSFDVLQLGSNEGAEYKGQLNLLFAASGDLRNVAKTIAMLPSSYNQPIGITINDHDPDIVARNTIMLLIALTVDNIDEAADCIIHIWYSALIRKSDLDILQHRIRPLIECVCKKNEDRKPSSLLGEILTFGPRSLRLVLEKSSWDNLLSYMDIPAGLTMERANQIRTAVTLAESRKDYRDRNLLLQTPSRRIAKSRYWGDGLLLPFGSPRLDFQEPNPTLFQTADTWPLHDNADPLNGWSLKEVEDSSSGPASADIYGKLFYYIHQELRTFLLRLSGLEVSFRLFQVNAADLPDHLENDSFSRIEVSNISDGAYLGIHRTVFFMVPLLQKPLVNPHATLITLFMNAVDERMTNQDRVAGITPHSQETKRLLKYLPPTDKGMMTNTVSPEVIKFSLARDLVGTYDHIFSRFTNGYKFSETAQYAGAAVKENNTVIDKWPFRLKLRPGQPGAQEEFDRLLSGGVSGKERYVEWKRITTEEDEIEEKKIT
ncbi:hypothetical protein V493_02929 [Pseudogymnoascus sp. VKM F-4281 (FW-2241)]|nr:hypothetical protein V493_02929 [Pseudogymnoascus sp. VKM F-4281 (FW-2241)]